MSEETVKSGNNVDTPVAENGGAAEGEHKAKSSKASGGMEAASKTINEAFKQVERQVENISKALGSALQDRANVVMVRVNDDSLAYLDMLVEADITKSRSESAAFLINEGIKSNEILFNRIREITDQIAALKAQLRGTVAVEEA
jgi:hypothetical protein